RPDPTVVHRLTLLAGSRRSGDYQAAALRAFVTACERADGDESTLAEARRGLAEIDSAAATPVRDAARLLARRWLEPELFAAEMRGKDASIADWRHCFADRHARSFWVDAVVEHGARRGESELRVVDRVLELLAAEPEDSPVYLPEVLFFLTERRPGWLVDGVLRKLEQGDANTRLRAAR
ncbi:MAG: hypothetical protein GY841_18055, partial [FCB group bacterium]|nr:hypothetical protein [FCB group bacterium]